MDAKICFLKFKLYNKDITEKPCNGKTVKNDRSNDFNDVDIFLG